MTVGTLASWTGICFRHLPNAAKPAAGSPTLRGGSGISSEVNGPLTAQWSRGTDPSTVRFSGSITLTLARPTETGTQVPVGVDGVQGLVQAPEAGAAIGSDDGRGGGPAARVLLRRRAVVVFPLGGITRGDHQAAVIGPWRSAGREFGWLIAEKSLLE